LAVLGYFALIAGTAFRRRYTGRSKYGTIATTIAAWPSARLFSSLSIVSSVAAKNGRPKKTLLAADPEWMDWFFAGGYVTTLTKD
jgi:hypothetical protein